MNFIPAKFYYDVYLLIATVLSIFCFNQYARKNHNCPLNIYADRKKAFLLFISFALFIGVRPISAYFGDMTQYWGIFDRWKGEFNFDWDVDNKIYNNQMMWFASKRVPPVIYYIYIAVIYYGGMYIACRKLFPGNSYAAFLVFITAFSTFAAGTNGIKAGSAASLFLVALAYRDNVKICVVFLLLSLGFHHSMQLPIAVLLIALLYNKNPKYYIYIWLFCFFVSAAHITYFQNLFAGLTDETGAEYLLGEKDENIIYDKGGFRLDFIVYSVMPIIMGWYALVKKGIREKSYRIIFCTYTLTNAIWMLCMYAEFTNRIAYLSWFMYPIVLIYPLFLEEWGRGRYKTFAKVAGAHLAFTLFMHLIYY